MSEIDIILNNNKKYIEIVHDIHYVLCIILENLY